MIDLTPISEIIQKRLFEKSIILAREKSSPNSLISLGGLDLNKLTTRSTFVRMVSGLEEPVILMGGELKSDRSMMVGYKDIYGPRDTDPNSFKRPMPGIKSANINFRGGARALREATVSWTCWSFDEIERLMPHFLSVGKTVLLEWGWVYSKDSLLNIPTFIGSDGKIQGDAFTDYKNTIIEANGDFDMIVGIVKNFEFNTRDDGGFDCQTMVTSVGVNILDNPQPTESSLNFPVKFDLSNDDPAEVTEKKLEDAKDDPNKLVNFNVGVSLKVFIKHINKYLSDKIEESYLVHDNFGTVIDKKIVGPNKYVHCRPNEFVIIYEGLKTISKTHDAWVRWGWFEDNILSKFLSLVSTGTDSTTPNGEFRSVKRLEKPDGKETKVYESVRIKNHPNFQTTNINNYILPSQFVPLKKPNNAPDTVKGDSDYLHILAGIVNSEKFKPFAIEDVDYQSMSEAEKESYKIEVGAAAGFSGEEEVIIIEYDDGTTERIVISPLLEKEDKKQLKAKVKKATIPRSLDFSQGYLRNMLINTKLIKEAFGVSDDDEFTVESINVREALEHMFALLNQDLHFWKFQITNDETEPYRSKIVDRNITIPLPDKKEKINDVFVKKPGTRSTYNNGQVTNRGVFFFPVWSHNSIVKKQNIRATIPNAMAVSIMYGANADQAKTLSTTPSEVGSEEGDAVSAVNNSEESVDINQKNISIALNQKDYEKYGAPSLIDDNVQLTKKGGNDDLKTWIFNNADLISDKYQSKFEKTAKAAKAHSEAAMDEELNKVIDDSVPPPLPDYLARDYPDAFKRLGSIEPVKGIGVRGIDTDVPNIASLYSAKFEDTGKMKEPFIESIRYNTTILKTTETTTTETSKPLLLPLNMELDIDGIGGILPGNSFHSTYLPKRYQQETLFQIFDVGHTVDSSGWTVSISGKMRSTLERLKEIKVEKILDKPDITKQFNKAKASMDAKQIKEQSNKLKETYGEKQPLEVVTPSNPGNKE